MNACDILIAGGGPVGAALALALRGSGLDVRLVEPAERRAESLRPVALSYGSRLILERLDAFDPALATPIETIHVSQTGGFGRTQIANTDLDVPALGYVVNLGAVAAQLKRRIAAEHVAGRVLKWQSTADTVTATLDDGATIQARLLVLADGGQSAGDDLAMRDYGQSAIVALVRTEAAPAARAWERFTPEGPLALLPFADRYALVWTVAGINVAPLLALSDELFLERLHARVGDRLGRFTEVSDRASVPLRLRFHSDSIAAARVVVVGNAAQTLHPVAGQGLNLGLRDAYELASLLRDTPQKQIGGAQFLAAYRARRRHDRGATIGITDALIRVFSNDDAAMRALRGVALAAFDIVPPARRFFARRMMYGLRALP